VTTQPDGVANLLGALFYPASTMTCTSSRCPRRPVRQPRWDLAVSGVVCSWRVSWLRGRSATGTVSGCVWGRSGAGGSRGQRRAL